MMTDVRELDLLATAARREGTGVRYGDAEHTGQAISAVGVAAGSLCYAEIIVTGDTELLGITACGTTVSYTHLTLPTIYSV